MGSEAADRESGRRGRGRGRGRGRRGDECLLVSEWCE